MKDERRRDLAEAERVVRDTALELGLEIVEFVFHSQGRHSQLRIDIDRPGSRGVGLADCERLSRALDERLEQLEFFDAPYELQVSSPGIDRPIRSDDDIRRNIGRPVRVTFKDEAGKVHEITGMLAGTDARKSIRLSRAQGETTVARESIVLMRQDVATGGPRRDEA